MANTLQIEVVAATEQARQQMLALAETTKSLAAAYRQASGAADALPASARAGEHGVSSLTEGLKDLRSEGRQAAFIARTLNEIGVAGGTAGRLLATLALSAAGGFGIVAAVEVAIHGVSLLVEHFKEAKEEEEKAKKATEDHGREVQKAADSWRDYTREAQSEGLSGSAKKFSKAWEEAKQKLDEVDNKLTELRDEREDLGAWYEQENLPDIMRSRALDKQIKEAEEARRAAEQGVKATQSGYETASPIDAAKRDEEIGLQRTSLEARFAGEEARIREEAERKKHEIRKRYAGPETEVEAGKLIAAVEIDRDAQITQAQARQLEERHALEVKAAEVTATDRQKIILAGGLATEKLLDAQKAATSQAEKDRIGALITAQGAVTREALKHEELQRSIAQRAETRAAQAKSEGVAADAARAAEIQGAQTIAAIEDRAAAARAKKGADAAADVAHLENLIRLQRELAAEDARIAGMQQGQRREGEERQLENRITETGGSDRRRIEVEGTEEVRRKEEELALVREREGYAFTHGDLAGLDAQQKEIAHLERLIALREQLTAAELAKYDKGIAGEVQDLRETGFDAERQRPLSQVRRETERETDLARSARDAGLVTPDEFDAWSAEIAKRSRAAALEAREPWIKDFGGGLKGALDDVFRSAVDGTFNATRTIKGLVAGLGSSLLNQGFDKAWKGILAGNPEKPAGATAAGPWAQGYAAGPIGLGTVLAPQQGTPGAAGVPGLPGPAATGSMSVTAGTVTVEGGTGTAPAIPGVGEGGDEEGGADEAATGEAGAAEKAAASLSDLAGSSDDAAKGLGKMLASVLGGGGGSPLGGLLGLGVSLLAAEGGAQLPSHGGPFPSLLHVDEKVLPAPISKGFDRVFQALHPEMLSSMRQVPDALRYAGSASIAPPSFALPDSIRGLLPALGAGLPSSAPSGPTHIGDRNVNLGVTTTASASPGDILAGIRKLHRDGRLDFLLGGK